MNNGNRKALILMIGLICQMGAIWISIGLYELLHAYGWAFVLSSIIASIVIWKTVVVLNNGKEVENA